MIHQRIVKTPLLAALGGIIASIVMYPLPFLTTSMTGIPLDDFSIARGMAISNINDNYYLNLILGIVMHLRTGAIAGAIFTIIVCTIKKFRLLILKEGLRKELFIQLLYLIM